MTLIWLLKARSKTSRKRQYRRMEKPIPKVTEKLTLKRTTYFGILKKKNGKTRKVSLKRISRIRNLILINQATYCRSMDVRQIPKEKVIAEYIV